MSFIDSARTFIEGVKSVIDFSGVFRRTISDAVSDGIANGIESAFCKIKKPFEQTMMKISCVFVSLFFIIWGVALFLDNFVPYRGLGFAITGAVFGIAALLFLGEKETK